MFACCAFVLCCVVLRVSCNSVCVVMCVLCFCVGMCDCVFGCGFRVFAVGAIAWWWCVVLCVSFVRVCFYVCCVCVMLCACVSVVAFESLNSASLFGVVVVSCVLALLGCVVVFGLFLCWSV